MDSNMMNGCDRNYTVKPDISGCRPVNDTCQPNSRRSRFAKGPTVDHSDFNRQAWDAIATSQHKWFAPASPGEIARARSGNPAIRLTATKFVPMHWLGNLQNRKVLCLAGGGGHQGPILAAAGAIVTVVDFSEAQLAIDRQVADEAGLTLETVQRDMSDLGSLGEFDLIVNPCSVNFCPRVRPVWSEAFRLLGRGGELLTGLINPVNYLFDEKELLANRFAVANKIPHVRSGIDKDSSGDSTLPVVPTEFAHSLDDLIGGQLAAGFQIIALFEDRWGGNDPLSERLAVFLATRAIKLAD